MELFSVWRESVDNGSAFILLIDEPGFYQAVGVFRNSFEIGTQIFSNPLYGDVSIFCDHE